MEKEHLSSLEYTPTWIVAMVCFVIILISLLAERGLHRLGKFLQRNGQDALHEALEKLKEELMLLGFISLLLTVFQGLISQMCIPPHLTGYMLPCKKHTSDDNGHEDYFNGGWNNRRKLFSEDSASEHCRHEGKVPLLSLEALHQLHIFIFVMAVVHVIFCVTTMVLGGIRIKEWKFWEDSLTREMENPQPERRNRIRRRHHYAFFKERSFGYWRKAAVVSWMISFFKQFYGSITKSDYIALREGFIANHCPRNVKFNFHKYLMRTLEYDFKKVVGISWYLWLFVVLFLLLNVEGWHTYFWLSFVPLVLLLLVGAKLEHIITLLAQEVEKNDERKKAGENVELRVKPSDELFWFHNPGLVLHLIHFILFQNAFEIAFFFWILFTYGFGSCIMEKLGYIIPRLIMGLLVQVLCSYSTLPLYTLVTQMGSRFRPSIFDKHVHSLIEAWYEPHMDKGSTDTSRKSEWQMTTLDREPIHDRHVVEPEIVDFEGSAISQNN